MGLRMPVLDGVEATRQITVVQAEIGIVVLTMFDDDELVFAAIRAGARGYLMKDADDVDIARVLRGIARGDGIFGSGTAQRLLDTAPYLSERTVRNDVSNILTKLDVDDRAEAITMARDAGLGRPPTRTV